MKISFALFLASIGSASAFVAPVAKTGSSALAMADPRREQYDGKLGGVDLEVRPANGFSTESDQMIDMIDTPKKSMQPNKSKSIPFMTVSPYLDGSIAGDVGFDPLGFADSEENLTKYREAEIRHARLAMLAAAGWPLSELFDRKLATMFDMEVIVDAANRAPSVLNGGMTKVSPFYWVFCIALAASAEVVGLNNVSKMKGYFPGNYNFDPLGFYPKEEKGQKGMRTAEIKNGRLAMIAITGFAFQEFATGVSVVDQSPFFFHPIWESLAANVPGYYIPEEAVQEAVTATASAVETVSAATSEAASVVPPVDVVSAATAEVASVVPSVDAVAATITPPVVDAVPAAPLEAAAVVTPAPTASMEELTAAKQRIVELESKLAEISNLSR